MHRPSENYIFTNPKIPKSPKRYLARIWIKSPLGDLGVFGQFITVLAGIKTLTYLFCLYRNSFVLFRNLSGLKRVIVRRTFDL